jgi:hypothetical protein
MLSMTGVVTIVQEARFQLLDDDGVSHQFLLAHSAAPDPEQLTALLRQRIRVSYSNPSNVIGHTAHRILLLETT